MISIEKWIRLGSWHRWWAHWHGKRQRSHELMAYGYFSCAKQAAEDVLDRLNAPRKKGERER